MNLIVAVDQNFAIGNKQELLCYLPEDLKNFKQLTSGHTVVMGYNTLMSLPGSKPLKKPKKRDPYLQGHYRGGRRGGAFLG